MTYWFMHNVPWLIHARHFGAILLTRSVAARQWHKRPRTRSHSRALCRYAHTHAHTHTCTHTHTGTHTHTHTLWHIHTHASSPTHADTHAHTHDELSSDFLRHQSLFPLPTNRVCSPNSHNVFSTHHNSSFSTTTNRFFPPRTFSLYQRWSFSLHTHTDVCHRASDYMFVHCAEYAIVYRPFGNQVLCTDYTYTHTLAHTPA